MKKQNKSVQIFQIEGKDLLTKNYRVTNKSNRKACLDDSMEVDKLKKVGKTIIKFNDSIKRYYSNEVISVNFTYSANADVDLSDAEYERLESLKLVLDMQQKNKSFDRESINNTKDLIKMASKKMNKKEIREQLYRYGFNININGKYKHFVRYKRTSGSARVGKCLFISERYYKEMIDWSFAGINHDIGTEMDCAGMEAYISLPTSSAIDRFKLEPKNILLVDDVYSEFEDTVMATNFVNQEYDDNGNVIGGDLETDVVTKKIKNNLFDGESLLDKSIFEEYGYGDKATLQTRNIFFKGIGINTDIQKFFSDNNITDVSQLNGKTIATDIKDIKLITTPSSVKYMKFGKFEDWLDKIEEEWAICKYEKPQKHFNGMVQTHYQLLNTLGMSKDSMEEFLEDTINYIDLLKTDIAVFKYHLGLNAKIETEDDIEEKEELSDRIENNNDFIMNMLEINDDFQFTQLFKKFRNNSVSAYINNIRKGHVLVEGNYSVIVSCPYEYLQHSIGIYNGESQLKPFECVSSKFNTGERLLAVRSPEPTMSNITMLDNVDNEMISKYFNINSKEVCYISPIKNNIMELLSSCDFDGDQFLITNNKYLIEHGDKLQETININGNIIKRFLVSTDFTPKSSIKRNYTNEDLCDVDIQCSSNKIGEIINLAQILNSLYWDKKFKKANEEELLDLYKDISNLNVLSCIEIDRAKKISPVDAIKELKKIREKHSLGKEEVEVDGELKDVSVRPKFFKYLDGGMNYKFKSFNTGMDYLNKVIDSKTRRNTKYTKIIPLHYILANTGSTKGSRWTVDKIKTYCKQMRNETIKIFASDMIATQKRDEYIVTKAITINKLKRTGINEDVVYTIIKRIGMSDKYVEYKDIGMLMIRLLYETNSKNFLKCIKVKKKKNDILIKDSTGKVVLYGINFRKIKK